METRRIILGMSGASGAILGIRLLDALHSTDIETHLIIHLEIWQPIYPAVPS